MSPEQYFAVMLITNPQKAKRILTAIDWENWFMDLFDDEYEDILEGTFKDNQEAYIDRIVEKYLETTGVKMTDKDPYSRSVIDKAFKTASEIQESTWRNITVVYEKKKSKESKSVDSLANLDISIEDRLAEYIKSGIAIGTALFATEGLRRWLGRERANLIALNEANWIWNNKEFFDAKKRYTKKTWHTALDEKVRMTHIALEGVTIPIDEPFHVGNSLMMMPLDTSLGADANEIINCRCTVEYSM